MNLHRCQKIPDTDYWVEVSGGLWIVRPKLGCNTFVSDAMYKLRIRHTDKNRFVGRFEQGVKIS